LPLDTTCDGLDRDGTVICRSVQYFARELVTDPFARSQVASSTSTVR